LIFGSSGRIGNRITRHLSEYYDVIEVTGRNSADLSDIFTLDRLIACHKPDFVVNAAGYCGKTNVDSCELNMIDCLNSNYLIPKNINECSKRYNFRWIHLSSGCLYDGYDKIFDENDTPNFVYGNRYHSLYSNTKYFGEQSIDNNCYILRIRMPFDYNIENMDGDYIKKILKYDKLISHPNSITYIPDFIRNIRIFIENEIDFGIYNMVNSTPVSSSDICNFLSKLGVLDSSSIQFISDEEFYEFAKSRRSNCILSNLKSISVGCSWTDTYTAIRCATTDFV